MQKTVEDLITLVTTVRKVTMNADRTTDRQTMTEEVIVLMEIASRIMIMATKVISNVMTIVADMETTASMVITVTRITTIRIVTEGIIKTVSMEIVRPTIRTTINVLSTVRFIAATPMLYLTTRKVHR